MALEEEQKEDVKKAETLVKPSKERHFSPKKVLDKNKNERHIRGGMATKEKYQKTSV